ncbi:RNA polymerase sigma factor SigF [Sesbania bispinosa]|nr:RNA polymerase sigma factor SigF [Sesbania bispinosa]
MPVSTHSQSHGEENEPSTIIQRLRKLAPWPEGEENDDLREENDAGRWWP